MKKFFGILLFCGLLTPAFAQDDFEIWHSMGAEKKFNKQWSMGAEAEWRAADNATEFSRWAVGADVEYKPLKHLKFAVGYKIINNHNPLSVTEKINMKANGFDYDTKEVKTTEAYWDYRHRASASATFDIDLGRFNISLREMYQYTHRMKATAMRTIREYEDFDDVYDGVPTWYDDYEETVKEKTFKAKDKHVLRSRLKVEYNIKGLPLNPYAGAELYNNMALVKSRYTLGVDWKNAKKHIVSAEYFYQNINGDDDDDDVNSHVLSVSYKYKF